MNFNPLLMIEIKRQQDELVKEIELIRQANESRQAEVIKPQTSSKVLAKIGKELASFGAGLEHRFGIQDESETKLTPQTNPEGCS